MAASIYSTIPVVENTILWFIFRILFHYALEIVFSIIPWLAATINPFATDGRIC